MDPADSDYHISATDSNEFDSGSDYSYGARSGRSVVLGEDAGASHPASDGSAGNQSPRKRAAEDGETWSRPFKRQKSFLNPDYLDMLNRDIDEAALRVCLEDDIALPASQLGLTYWSALEKKQFFEALSRLGRHDLPGIAERIGTKSTIEVKHYLHVLQEAVLVRRTQDRRSFLEPVEYPAAVELTQLCCNAQEEAADAVSIKQELREIQREEEKWQRYWDITPQVAAELEKEHADKGAASMGFVKLLHVPRWLKLADRMFMNSSIPGSNWHNIDSRPPSMWATTLDDFHSLALSITRRLVQTTLFISMSRIRAKSILVPGTRKVVRKKDVEAAIASLGLSHNSNDLWLKSARRLRLDVYENPPLRGDEEEEDPMTYDEVEAELADAEPPRASNTSSTSNDTPELPSEDELESPDDSDYSEGQRMIKGEEEYAVDRETNEILDHSAVGIRDLQSTRRALKLRIEIERRQERNADIADDQASYAAETAMWDLLQKEPPMPRPRMPKSARATTQRSIMDVEDLYPTSRTWADDLEYHAEWETLQRPLDAASHENPDDD